MWDGDEMRKRSNADCQCVCIFKSASDSDVSVRSHSRFLGRASSIGNLARRLLVSKLWPATRLVWWLCYRCTWCYRSDTRPCCRGLCLLYISWVFLLLSSLYHRIHAQGSPQLPYRNRLDFAVANDALWLNYCLGMGATFFPKLTQCTYHPFVFYLPSHERWPTISPAALGHADKCVFTFPSFLR